MKKIGKVHKFFCTEGHFFYIPLELPKPVNEVARTLKGIACCPLCQNEDISMSFEGYYVVREGME